MTILKILRLIGNGTKKKSEKKSVNIEKYAQLIDQFVYIFSLEFEYCRSLVRERKRERERVKLRNAL